jgi:ferric iron reductase protein FhuF
MISLLSSLFSGDWADYGKSLVCTTQPPSEALTVSKLLAEPAHLDAALSRVAGHLKTSDLRPVACVWYEHYLNALLPSITAAATLLRHAIPVLPGQLSLSMNQQGYPVTFYIDNEGRSFYDSAVDNSINIDGAGATHYRIFLEQHLSLLTDCLHRQAKVPKKILWGVAAREFEPLFREAALKVTGTAAADRVKRDREYLLYRSHWPDGDVNPLFTPLRQAVLRQNGQSRTITLHRQCCLIYLLPDTGYCNACPLAPQYRKIKGAK